MALPWANNYTKQIILPRIENQFIPISRHCWFRRGKKHCDSNANANDLLCQINTQLNKWWSELLSPIIDSNVYHHILHWIEFHRVYRIMYLLNQYSMIRLLQTQPYKNISNTRLKHFRIANKQIDKYLLSSNPTSNSIRSRPRLVSTSKRLSNIVGELSTHSKHCFVKCSCLSHSLFGSCLFFWQNNTNDCISLWIISIYYYCCCYYLFTQSLVLCTTHYTWMLDSSNEEKNKVVNCSAIILNLTIILMLITNEAKFVFDCFKQIWRVCFVGDV